MVFPPQDHATVCTSNTVNTATRNNANHGNGSHSSDFAAVRDLYHHLPASMFSFPPNGIPSILFNPVVPRRQGRAFALDDDEEEERRRSSSSNNDNDTSMSSTTELLSILDEVLAIVDSADFELMAMDRPHSNNKNKSNTTTKKNAYDRLRQ